MLEKISNVPFIQIVHDSNYNYINPQAKITLLFDVRDVRNTGILIENGNIEFDPNGEALISGNKVETSHVHYLQTSLFDIHLCYVKEDKNYIEHGNYIVPENKKHYSVSGRYIFHSKETRDQFFANKKLVDSEQEFAIEILDKSKFSIWQHIKCYFIQDDGALKSGKFPTKQVNSISGVFIYNDKKPVVIRETSFIIEGIRKNI